MSERYFAFYEYYDRYGNPIGCGNCVTDFSINYDLQDHLDYIKTKIVDSPIRVDNVIIKFLTKLPPKKEKA